jgi:chromate reductase, NAD(P)H dehydrogenase (quinone)
MRILGISGSLRMRSSNAAVLRAAAAAAPPGSRLDVYEGLGALPYFNPDLDEEGAVAPPAVAALRAAILASDAVVICSPEYAHGVPGVLKNGLDWLVSDGTLVGKAVAVVTAGASGGEHAQGQLVETLRTMSWRVVEAACLQLPLSRAHYDERGELREGSARDRLRAAVAALVAAAAS